MAVQQGELGATDTTKDMENFYNDAVVDRISDVDRIIHNATQFVRLVLQRPQAVNATRADSATPLSTTETPHYIDGLLTANPTSNTNLMVIGFDTNVTTTSIVVFSTGFIDPTSAKWTVSTSLNNLVAEFDDSNFEATVSSVVQAIESGQFKYTITVGTPAVDTTGEGLPFWRLVHADSEEFNDVTEVQIIEPLTPTLSYFDTDGGFASSFTFEKSNILDACFDTTVSPDGVFYTIRFNSDNVGTSTVDFDDDFSEAEAGTASGTNNFNPARWTESNTNTAFLRVNELVSHNVAAGDGQLETTYTVAGNFEVQIDVIPTTVTTEEMWFVLRALDETNNNTVIQEGMGLETSPVTSGVFFASRVDSLVNSTADCALRELRPQWHNSASGTDSFTLTFSGSVWVVSGTLTGRLTDADTGVPYDETVDSTTPIDFLISCTATPTTGEKFTFDLTTANVKKDVTESATVGIQRVADSGTTTQVFADLVGPISTDDVSFELYGNTNAVINISADNYLVTSGTGSFPDVSVFTVEKTDSEGQTTGTPLIESFDVIGESNKTYNDFLDGRVMIACSSSGTSGGGNIYIKVDNILYKYLNNISLGTEDGSSAIVSTTAQISKDGTNSFAWTHESGINGTPFLTYIEFDDTLDIVHLQTLNKDTLLDTTSDKEVLLDISDYDTNRYEIFYDQNDFDTLYYVDSSANLQSWNIDDRISAFIAVNAEDVTLPAGTAQQTFVNADVINAWGEAKGGKVVTFSVTAGDGAVSPSSDTTDSGGRSTTQFTVGSTVGVSTVTATVTET